MKLYFEVRQLVGYVICLIGAITAGVLLFQQGATIPLILFGFASAWAGGIFFLLLYQGRYSSGEDTHDPDLT